MTPSPLDDTIRRACGLEVAGWPLVIARRDGPGDGFERADDLHRPGRLLDQRIAASAALGNTHHRHVGAQWWFERCAWLVASASLGCVLSSGWLPSLRPTDVLIASADGMPTAIGFRDVPLAWDRPGRPGVGAVLRSELEAHLAPLVDSISARRLRPVQGLWRSAGDRVVQSALWAGAAAGRPEQALALTRGVLDGDSPLSVPVRVATASTGDPMQQRASCCLAHRTPSKFICESCPRAHRLDAR